MIGLLLLFLSSAAVAVAAPAVDSPAAAGGAPPAAAARPALPAGERPTRDSGATAHSPGNEIRVQLTPRRSTVLASDLAGRIMKLTVREGDGFQQGQVLAAFDCTQHRARLERAEALVREARKVHEVNAQLDTLGSSSVLELEVAEARRDAAVAEAALARALVERCEIVAPFKGRVAELLVKRYQYVPEGQPLLDIIDDSVLEVEMIVPSRWLAWLRPGLGFSVRIEDTAGSYPAVVDRLVPRIDPVSQSVKVFGRLTGAFPELMAGMSGTVYLAPPPAE